MRIKPWLNPDYGLLLALVLPLFAIMPLLSHAGLPNTADGPAHLMRQVELNQAWQEGNFYPRWGRDLAFGHGMPIFSYAPPALYQLTQLFHLSGLPLDAAMKAVLIFDFLLYSLGMFLLARRLFGPRPALLAAALYVYAPYRLREAYIQGNYGQFTGLAFYPLILWAFHGLITTGRPRYLLAAAFSLAGLLFSHNISFMLFAPIFAAYLLFLLWLTASPPPKEPAPPHTSRFTFQVSHFISVTIAGLLGLGLAAIFWLPAFGERHEIQLAGITQGFFDFRENFISPSEFFSPPLPLDLAAINPKFPLSLGLPQLIGAAFGFISLIVVTLKPINPQAHTSPPNPPPSTLHPPPSTLHPPSSILHPPSSIPALFFASFFLLYTFLALPQSQPLWEAVPLLELAEFPWRMLGPAIFCASLLAAFSFSVLDSYLLSPGKRFPFFTSPLISYYSLLLSLFLPIALNAYYLYPSQFIVWGTPTPADAFAYEISSGAIGTTSTGEFLPRYAQDHPRSDTLWPDYAAGQLPQKVDPATLPAGAAIETIAAHAESDTFRIRTPQAFEATLRTLYWPGWQVYLDDQPVAFDITDRTGLIQTLIPAGEHTLILKLGSTPLRTIGQWLTLLSFVILLGIAGFAFKKQVGRSVPPQTINTGLPSPVSRPAPIPLQFFAAATILLVITYFLSRLLSPLFTLQSNPDRPQPAGQLLQVDFSSKTDQSPSLRLVGMDNLPSAVAITPDSEPDLVATLYWRAVRDLDTNYSVFLHLDAPNGQTFATVDEVHPENIPTRNWPPGLYLRNPLHLKIPANLPPIRYTLNVGLYDHQSNQRLVILPGAETTFSLGAVWLTPPQPTLPPAPLARFGPHITLWQSLYPSADNQALVLTWQCDQPIDQDYTIFIHLLDASGEILAQADGIPYDGLYPLTHWQPGQIITDERPITPLLANPGHLSAIAIGIYNPTNGERLPVTDASGQPFPDNRFVMPVQP